MWGAAAGRQPTVGGMRHRAARSGCTGAAGRALWIKQSPTQVQEQLDHGGLLGIRGKVQGCRAQREVEAGAEGRG